MSNGTSRKRFDKLLISLMTGKIVEGSEILAVVVLMKESAVRDEWLDSLYSKAPCDRLPITSYCTLVDLMRASLRESNNTDDYKAIFKIFYISNLYGMKSEGVAMTLKSALRNHEAWYNPNFWFFCAEELVARDVCQWTRYSSVSFDLLAMDENHVNAILCINRIQSIFSSMCSVGVDDAVKETYLTKALTTFGLTSNGINILVPPTDRFVAWLLDMALAHREEQSGSGRGQSREEEAVVDKRSRSAELGYSPLQQMLFYVAHMLVGAGGNDDGICVCGQALGGWQPLGIYDTRLSLRENLPCVLCETCFRQILANPLMSEGSYVAVKRCVVPMTEPEPPTSFGSVFYGFGTTEQRASDMQLDLSNFTLPILRNPVPVQRPDPTPGTHSVVSSVGSDTAWTSLASDISASGTFVDSSLGSTPTKHPFVPMSAAKSSLCAAGPGDSDRLEHAKFLSMMRVGVDVVKMGRSALSRHHPRTIFLDSSHSILCWAPPGRAELVMDPAHSVPLNSLRQIRVGAGRWAKCVSLVFTARTLVLQVEEQRLFKILVDGLIQLTDSGRVRA